MRPLEGQGELGRGVDPDEMRRYQMFIDGRWRSGRSERVMPSVNPTTERVCAELQEAEAEDVDRAATAADRAFEDEAIRLANTSRYTFTGGMFSVNNARALRISRALRAGRLWINTYRTSSPLVPFGGFRKSGYGREAGLAAIRDFTETKALMIDTPGSAVADPFVMR